MTRLRKGQAQVFETFHLFQRLVLACESGLSASTQRMSTVAYLCT